MSLLADLLSKVKYKSTGTEEHKTDIPPDLKRIVSASAEKKPIRKKVIIFSVLIVFAIISGFIAVYLMDFYVKPSAQKTVRSLEAPLPVPAQQTGVMNQTAQDIEQKANKDAYPSTVKQETNADRPHVKDKGQEKKMTKYAEAPNPQKLNVDKPKTVERAKKIEGEIISERKIADIQKAEERTTGSNKAAAAEPAPKIHNPQRDAYLYTAKTYESGKDYHKALLNYKKALEIEPDNYIIMSNIASVLIRLDSIEESMHYAKNALAVKKDHVPSLINLGIAYIRLGNTAEGEGHFSRALSIEPSNSYALLNLGLLYEKQGDNDRAYSYFSKLSERGDVQGYLGIARIAEKQGRASEAARIYSEIKALNNIDPQIRKLASDRLLQLGH